MKKLILLFCIAMVSSASVGEKVEVDPERYPVTGVLSMDLGRLLTVASTNLPDGATVSLVSVHKKTADVRTVVVTNGLSTAGDTLIFDLDGREWKLKERTKPENESLTVGLPIADLVAFAGSFPLGPKLLSVIVRSETKIDVVTGRVDGPLAGGGKRLTYEKQDGRWTKTGESMWVS